MLIQIAQHSDFVRHFFSLGPRWVQTVAGFALAGARMGQTWPDPRSHAQFLVTASLIHGQPARLPRASDPPDLIQLLLIIAAIGTLLAYLPSMVRQQSQ